MSTSEFQNVTFGCIGVFYSSRDCQPLILWAPRNEYFLHIFRDYSEKPYVNTSCSHPSSTYTSFEVHHHVSADIFTSALNLSPRPVTPYMTAPACFFYQVHILILNVWIGKLVPAKVDLLYSP